MPAEINVVINGSCRFEIECPECGALVDFEPGDERVVCIDYDDLP